MSRILVVDDEPAIGWGLRELFRDCGHDVVVAADLDAAGAACRPGAGHRRVTGGRGGMHAGDAGTCR